METKSIWAGFAFIVLLYSAIGYFVVPKTGAGASPAPVPVPVPEHGAD